MTGVECTRCSICGRDVGGQVLCTLVTDWGQAFESCSCICENCRQYLTERRDLTLWEQARSD